VKVLPEGRVVEFPVRDLLLVLEQESSSQVANGVQFWKATITMSEVARPTAQVTRRERSFFQSNFISPLPKRQRRTKVELV
jgi:hypothetical protein